MIVELHLLQSFPVSNLNRDDLGQPKSATFGGVPRGRVSSQCLKRSARDLLKEHGLPEVNQGKRTKRLLNATADLLTDQGRDRDEAREIVAAGLRVLGFGVVETESKADDEESKLLTQYLLFIGTDSVERLAEFCQQNWDTLAKKAQQDAKAKKGKEGKDDNGGKETKPSKKHIDIARRMLDASRAADIALFGRMIADNTDFNVAAASQVAHALSTHAVVTEFDYYTAVDDLKRDDEPGADMIGTVNFNSACYYRYANLDIGQLTDNLPKDDELVTLATRAWLGAFVHATPSGKQTGTAARTMPETLLGTVRHRGAWNLANAFLTPVTDRDLMAGSTDRMLEHFQRLRSFYGQQDFAAVAGASVSADISTALPDEETVSSVDEFTERLMSAARGE